MIGLLLLSTVVAATGDADAAGRALRRRRAGWLVLLVALFAAVAVPPYQQARREAQDRAARRLLLRLHQAQLEFHRQHHRYARLDQLQAAGLSPVGEGDRHQGFVYHSAAGTDTYTITARPLSPDGQPHTIDDSGLPDRPATAKRRRPPTPQERLAQARARAREQPNSAPAWIALAEALEAQNHPAEAVEAARRAARLDRQAGVEALYTALLARADALLRARQAAAALPLLKEAAALRPKDADAPALLGDAYRLLGRDQEALRAYRQATKLGMTAARAWLGLGRLHEARGERAEAGRCYLRVINIGADAFVPDAWVNESWAALQRLGGIQPKASPTSR
ncbi:MAG: tetratricopeptide repeat protein [Armatimonadetes bacterium]|nr:tetratricopeptide repeat protein [Armatimonadota bacterium]